MRSPWFCYFMSSVLAAGIISCGQKPIQAPDSSQIKIIDPALQDLELLNDGPFSFDEADYDTGPFFDSEILPTTSPDQPRLAVDIRGRLFLPKTNRAVPLIVFLHGNHGTCGIQTGPGNPRLDIGTDFTTEGRCPPGYVEVPNHRGYDYSARHLASWGYAVISINANRGITGRNSQFAADQTLVYARGIHVLKHLEYFYQWSKDNSSSAPLVPMIDLTNRLDWSRVGLMGHSRGGEGVRYAYNIFTFPPTAATWQARIPGLTFRGVFEIAPVDGGTSTAGRLSKINAIGLPWTVIIPGCDQDVKDFSGTHPFARMLNLEDSYSKSVFTIWGANHNFFNTEWQVSDAPHSCNGFQSPLWNVAAPALDGPYINIAGLAKVGVTGSKQQTDYAKGLLFAFFHAHLSHGEYEYFDRIFDPQYHLPSKLNAIAPSNREYVRPHENRLIFRPTQDLRLPRKEGQLRLKTIFGYLDYEFTNLVSLINKQGKASGRQPLLVLRQADDFIRPSLAITIPSLEQTQTLSFNFPQAQNLSDIWTIDLPLAQRSLCYEGQSNCATLQAPLDFTIALVLADGSTSHAVQLVDYIKLQNWYASFYELEARQQSPLLGGQVRLYFRSVPLLFQTARLETLDFQLANPQELITGLELRFLPSQIPIPPTTLFLGDISISKHSAASTLPP